MNQSIKGLQEANDACLKLLAALRPTGALGKAVQFGLAAAHRYAVATTPHDTGAWRASHRATMKALAGELTIDPSARNPKNGQPPAIYAAALARRKGGRYDVYRTVYQQQGDIARAAAESFIAELPQ